MATTYRILLIAFEPFGGDDTNRSLEVLEKVADIHGVIKACLPVSFVRAPQELRRLVEEHQPQVIICMGQTASGDNIRLERYAHNMMDSSKADNDGVCPDEERIAEDKGIALTTSLPLKNLAIECKNMGGPIVVSNSAGLYVCNRVYFEALSITPQSLFIHIPKTVDTPMAIRVVERIVNELIN